MINMEENNSVNNPDHYQSKCEHVDIDCISAMRAAYGDSQVAIWCKLNAFKYLWRCDDKDSLEEDLSKASWYINKFMELD